MIRALLWAFVWACLTLGFLIIVLYGAFSPSTLELIASDAQAAKVVLASAWVGAFAAIVTRRLFHEG